MTREEAIKGFKYMKEGIYPFDPSEYLDMAIKALEQGPEFIAKSDGTIEQITNCNDCLFKKEWEKIGKLLSVVLKKQTEQESQAFKWCTDCREYDQEKHCCHRWSKVIRNTVEEMKQGRCDKCEAGNPCLYCKHGFEPQESEET